MSYDQDWILTAARKAVRAFVVRHAALYRLAGDPQQHYLWPAYQRINRLATEGRLPADPQHATRYAVRAGRLAAVDEARQLTGRPGSDRSQFLARLSSLDTVIATEKALISFGEAKFAVHLRDMRGLLLPASPRRSSHEMDVERLLRRFTPRERVMIRMYFGIGRAFALSLGEIGEHFGLSEPGVSYVIRQALDELAGRGRNRAKVQARLRAERGVS